MKKIALSGSRAKLKILNGKLEEGFLLLKSTAQKFKSFATDLADRIPQTLAARISLNLFSHFETKSSKRLGIPKGIVLGGVLALMASLPAAGQTFINAPTTAALDAAIVTANGNPADHVIRLEAGQTYTLTASLTTVANNGTLSVICTGTTNAIIDGATNYRPFTMAVGSDLTLDKITVQNGFVANGNGGGIFNNQGDLTISNSLITNNEVTGANPNGRGAGIYSTGTGSSASVLIQNSTISLNSASSYGGGVDNRESSLLTISSSSISGNTSNQRGGGIFNLNSDNLSISSSSISGNTSSSTGGGIFNQNSDNVTISSSSISGNTSTVGGGIWNFNSNLSIQASSLTTNQATAQGGAMMIYGSFGGGKNVLIQNTTISGNSSTGSVGGGIYHNNLGGVNNITLQHVTMSDNTGNGAAGTGDGFHNEGGSDITFQNSIIANSTGAGSDFRLGAASSIVTTATIIESSTSVITSATVADPMLNALSGGVHTLQAGSPAIDAASTTDATTNDQLGVLRTAPHDIGAVQFAVAAVACPIDVTTNADAGAGSLRQAILDANANISDCVIYLDGGETYTIASNLPIVTGTDVGGTLSIISTGTLNAVIDGNNLHRPLTMASGSNLTISKITVQNGLAIKGGGVYNHHGDLTISNSLITNNNATGPGGAGGAIFNRGNNGNASVLIQNSTISLNSASQLGAGIYNFANSPMTINNTIISNNTGNNQGGGVFNSTNSPLSITSSSIMNNASGYGGGIYNTGSSPLNITCSSFVGNTSTNQGGGIYNQNSSPLTLLNSTISLNSATTDGGGIFNRNSSNLTISSSSISGNTSTIRGGGIWNGNSNLSIQASSLSTNQSAAQGGAMMIYGAGGGGQNVLIQNTTISGNSSTGNAGGGVFHDGIGQATNAITFQQVTLSGNSGVGTGGFENGNIFGGLGSVTLQNTIIANSTGADFGNSGGGALTLVTGTIVEDGTMAGAASGDPMLNALSGGVHTLQTGSIAIDAASTADATANDQLGVVRVAPHDIGAIEFGAGVCMVVTAPAGVTNTWIGCTNSDWNTATNWSTGLVPTASDVVYVPIVAANQLIIDEVATCAKMVVQIGAKCLVNYNAGGRLQIQF